MEKPSRAILFATLSILWIFPSTGAIWIICAGSKAWLRSANVAEGLQAVRIEEWIAFLLLAIHAVFTFLAWRLRGFRAMRT